MFQKLSAISRTFSHQIFSHAFQHFFAQKFLSTQTQSVFIHLQNQRYRKCSWIQMRKRLTRNYEKSHAVHKPPNSFDWCPHSIGQRSIKQTNKKVSRIIWQDYGDSSLLNINEWLLVLNFSWRFILIYERRHFNPFWHSFMLALCQG
jgi:hypothetical protein